MIIPGEMDRYRTELSVFRKQHGLDIAPSTEAVKARKWMLFIYVAFFALFTLKTLWDIFTMSR